MRRVLLWLIWQEKSVFLKKRFTRGIPNAMARMCQMPNRLHGPEAEIAKLKRLLVDEMLEKTTFEDALSGKC